jgi:glycosyltransferase involved in cell wall biosynthesis
MKITITMGFFLPVPPLRGGATEKIWYRFAQEFAEAGHDVTLISRQWPGLPNHEQEGRISHVRLPGRNHTRRLPMNLALDFLWSLRLLRVAPHADVIVSNNVALPVLAPRLRPNAGKFAVVLGRMPKGQTRFYNGVDRVLATSSAVLERVRVENPALVARARVMLNPVDTALLARLNAKPRSGQPLTIGYVGRINPEKGLETLIDAAAALRSSSERLPPWRLVFIGPFDIVAGGGGDGYRDALLSRAHSRGFTTDNFEFVGPIYDATTLARRYGEIDIFCYPTRAEQGEGLSVAPIEAMSAGAVPVVSDLPCFSDLIVSEENGLIFNHRAADPTLELTNALSRLLVEGDTRGRLSARAQTDVHRFDYSVIAARLLSDFSELCGAQTIAASS